MDGAAWWTTICPSEPTHHQSAHPNPPINHNPKKNPQLERDRRGSDVSASVLAWNWWSTSTWKRTDGERRKYERMRELWSVFEKKKWGRDWQKDEREKNKKFIKIIPHLSVRFHIWERTVDECQIFWDLEHLIRDVFWCLVCQMPNIWHLAPPDGDALINKKP